MQRKWNLIISYMYALYKITIDINSQLLDRWFENVSQIRILL